VIKHVYSFFNVKYALFLSGFLIKIKLFRQILEKYANTKFHKNPPCGSWALSCGQTDRHEKSNCKKRL